MAMFLWFQIPRQGTFVMKKEALCWPNSFKRATAFQQFFRDVPIIGLDARAHAFICRQLIGRSPDCSRVWDSDARSAKCLKELLRIISDVYCWPNDLFLPEDPCEIVFWCPRNDLKTAEAMMRISEKFELHDQFLDDFQRLSFGELVLRCCRPK